MPYSVTAYGLTDKGLVREHNEDVWAELPEQRFYVLADGMGGHKSGDVASREAVDHLCRIVSEKLGEGVERLSPLEGKKLIEEAIQEVNAHVFSLGQKDSALRGMGTTLCCLYFCDDVLVFGHVGDSRIYLLRKQKILQLTKDHSWIQELLDMGQILDSQAEDFVYKNIITKAVGIEPRVEPAVSLLDLQDQDLFLMCTDGLTDMIPKVGIERILTTTQSFEKSPKKLIDEANMQGGYDNVTVVLVKVERARDRK